MPMPGLDTHTDRAREYTIAEAAELSGLPKSTLRYYETIGLLGPVQRDRSSKHRSYTEADIDLVVAVACLSTAGMSIDDMRSYLANRERGDAAAAQQVELLSAQQRRLRSEARALQLRQDYIEAKLVYWRAVQAGDDEQRTAITARVHEIARQLRTVNKEPQA
jgi:DNA-binding transcriptional MerR regulator